MWDYANNLFLAGYIIMVHHLVPADVAPPTEWFIVTWKGRHYYLKPDDNKGFTHSGQDYSTVMLTIILVKTCLQA
jgi:hypothetical protein